MQLSHTCLLFKSKVLKHGYCNRPASLVKLLQKKCLVSDMCAGPVPHNQTCIMIKMSADPVAMMAGLLVLCSLDRHAYWQGEAWTDMPAEPVQQLPTFLLVGCNCNLHYCLCDVTNTHECWPRVLLTSLCAGSIPNN